MSLTRRLFLQLAAAVSLDGLSVVVAQTNPRPLAGAIRWDAWYSPGSTPTSAVEKSLAPQRYHWRLPFFANVSPDPLQPVSLPKLSQNLIDLEIEQAYYAGLDYWAFLAYGKNDPMSLPLKSYLASKKRNLVKFCLFSELVSWGTANERSPNISDHVSMMARPEYVRVIGDRPLYFLGFIDSKTVREKWGDFKQLSKAIDYFRDASKSAGVGDPYVVVAGPLKEANQWTTLSADAISAYSLGDPVSQGSYSSLERLTEERWKSLSGHSLPLIPTVMAGYDRRPRVEHPVPWEPSQRPYQGIQNYYEEPTGQELEAHLRTALKFVSDQPSEKRAPALLIYAWNENDEGGWLIPTRPCDTSRLDALHRVLGQSNARNPRCAIAERPHR